MTRLNNDHCTFFSMQVLSIISPERYIEQLLEEQNQGTFSVCMANGIPENDVRLYFHINQLGKPELLKLHRVFNTVQWLCSFGAVLVANHYAESWLQRMRMAMKKNKGWLAVIWSTVSVCMLLNVRIHFPQNHCNYMHKKKSSKLPTVLQLL